ncbi:hypothetical protein O6935_04295 [Chlamydia sp. 26-15]|uniref:hypothetical protein n=1 Tax=Chlamydia sp. 26-15 TaxID=3015210 RepID=UPI002FC5BEF4
MKHQQNRMAADIKDFSQKHLELNKQYFENKSEIRDEIDACKNLLKNANTAFNGLKTMIQDNQYCFAFIAKQKNIPISKNPTQKN